MQHRGLQAAGKSSTGGHNTDLPKESKKMKEDLQIWSSMGSTGFP